MNGIIAFYNSTVGRKIVMSLTGLFICLFLIEHLIGNLLLLLQDGGVSFDAYAEFLTANPYAYLPLRIIELFLFFTIIVHAWSGVTVWLKNRRARPVKYMRYGINENARFGSRWMIGTALLILLFLIIHLKEFFFEMRFTEAHPSGYKIAYESFRNPYYVGFYVFAFIVLGFHLYHGFQSAFQTLGLRTKKYISLIEAVAVIFWFIIPLGFAMIPIYILLHPYSIALAK